MPDLGAAVFAGFLVLFVINAFLAARSGNVGGGG